MNKRKKSASWLTFTLVITILVISGCSIESQEKTLKEAFANYYYIGTAMNEGHITGNDTKSVELIKKHFNSITAENVQKWERIHPEPETYDFELSDKFVEFGLENDMFIIGHTLVWHSQTPNWVFENEDGNPKTKEELLQTMKDHIFTVAGRYKGKIDGWDVVNEAVEGDGSMRQTKWMEIIGEKYIEKAFIYANEAAPDAELYYNDYDMWKKGKYEKVVELVKDLQAKGIKIDGVGLQGHWGLDYPTNDELIASLEALSQLGVKIMITELDLNILPNPFGYTGAEISTNFELRKELNPYPDGLPDSMHVVQSNRYSELFNIFNDYKDHISRVTFWGVTDGQSWQNYWPMQGRTTYPLLFDRNFQPKPAFDAVIETVK